MTRRRRPVRRRSAVVVAAVMLGAVLAPTSWTPQVAALSILPIAVPDTHAMKHDRTATVPPPGVLGNDLDILGSTTAILTANPTHGTVNLRPDGGYTYVPVAGYVGTDVFRYRPSALLGLTTATKVTITITNAVPVAVNNSYTAVTAQTLSVAAPGVRANDTDADGDGLTAQLVDGGGNGSLSFSSNGSFTFKSGGSFTGIRTFTYRVSDGIAWSAAATVSIDVRAPAPTPPPTPAPTPPPTPTPPPIVPLPTLPLPTLPLPTLPLPTLPLPTLPLPTPPRPTLPPLPIPTATPTRNPGPTGSPGVTPSPSASPAATSSPAPSPLPGTSSNPSSTPGPGGIPSAPTETPGSGGTGGGVTPGEGGRFTVGLGGLGLGPIDGLVDVDTVGFQSLLEWAVPALLLSVPGLLLLIAVLAQVVGGLLWLPFARRWLGGFGFRRRRSRSGDGR